MEVERDLVGGEKQRERERERESERERYEGADLYCVSLCQTKTGCSSTETRKSDCVVQE